MGISAVIPVLSFIIVFMTPESPRWLMVKGRNEEALQCLIKLRGKNNMEMINTEIESIATIISEGKEKGTNELPNGSAIRRYWNILTDRTFLEPFGLVLLIFAIGLEWGGFPTITFYMVPFLKYVSTSL